MEEEIKAPELDCLVGTVYHAVEEQTDSTPLITADGSKINKENLESEGCNDIERLRNQKDKWLAVSRDMLKKYDYGSEVIVFIEDQYIGKFTVHDTMNKRFTNRVDFLTSEKIYNKWETVRILKTEKRPVLT